MADHVESGDGPPTSIPSELSLHYTDLIAKQSYISVGISSAADWEKTTNVGGGAWGTITGTLSDQTDLQSELDGKENTLPLTTRGDLLVRNAANATARLAVGAAGKVLKSDGSDVSWEDESGGGAPGLESTALISGGAVTVNVDPAKINVEAGIIQVADAFTDPSSPIPVPPIPFGPFTGVVITNLATEAGTEIMINSSGALIQRSVGTITPEILRDEVLLSSLVHASLTQIDIILEVTAQTNFSPGNSLADFSIAVGTIVPEGNIFSANGANLFLNKSAGIVFGIGINYKVNRKNPHFAPQDGIVAASWIYTWRDGASGWNVSIGDTAIVPGSYDDNTGGASVPNGSVSNNKYSVPRIFISTANDVLVYYGQITYDSIAEAQAVLQSEAFEENPSFKGAIFRGWLIVKGNATDLSNVAQAQFFSAGKFGNTASAGSTSTTNLQQAYNNSAGTEIVLTPANGALSIKDAATPIGAPLFTIKSFGAVNDYIKVEVLQTTFPNIIDSGLTNLRAVASDGFNRLVSSITTLDELAFLSGLISNAQNQLDTKSLIDDEDEVIFDPTNTRITKLLATSVGVTITGTATTTNLRATSMTASRAAMTNAAGTLVSHATVTDVELGYLDGVTSSIQDQLDTKTGGGKNYIINPDATLNATDGVDKTTGVSGTGIFAVDRTLDVAKQAEGSKGTGFEISGDSNIVAGDYIAWAIINNKIDAADGVPSTVETKLKDIGGIAGHWLLKLYSVTLGIYIGEFLTSISDGTYTFGDTLIAGDNYEFHLVATQASPAAVGMSGVDLEPTAFIIGATSPTAWQPWDPTNTQGFGTIVSRLQWRQNGENFEGTGDLTAGTSTAVEAQLGLPNNYTIDWKRSTSTVGVGYFETSMGPTSLGRRVAVLATHGDTFFNFGTDISNTTDSALNEVNGNNIAPTGSRNSLFVSVPVAEFANSGVVVPLSDLRRMTKEVTLAYSNVPGGWTADFGSGIAYRDSLGKWRLVFSLGGTGNTFTTETLDINGIVTKGLQSLSCVPGNTGGHQAQIEDAGNTITINKATTGPRFTVSGDIALASEPTDAFVGADSNFSNFADCLENAISIAGLVKEATSEVAGIVKAADSTMLVDGGNANARGGSSGGETTVCNFAASATEDVGAGITRTAQTTTTGDFYEIKEVGSYAIMVSARTAVANFDLSITLNSKGASDPNGTGSDLTSTAPDAMSGSIVLQTVQEAAANACPGISVSKRLQVGDRIRIQCNADPVTSAEKTRIRIEQITKF